MILLILDLSAEAAKTEEAARIVENPSSLAFENSLWLAMFFLKFADVSFLPIYIFRSITVNLCLFLFHQNICVPMLARSRHGPRDWDIFLFFWDFTKKD
jgi:hypothetical protein